MHHTPLLNLPKDTAASLLAKVALSSPCQKQGLTGRGIKGQKFLPERPDFLVIDKAACSRSIFNGASFLKSLFVN